MVWTMLLLVYLLLLLTMHDGLDHDAHGENHGDIPDIHGDGVVEVLLLLLLLLLLEDCDGDDDDVNEDADGDDGVGFVVCCW